MEHKRYADMTVSLDGLPVMDDILEAIGSLRRQARAEFGEDGFTEETLFVDRQNVRQGFGTDTTLPCLILRAVRK